MHTTVPLGSQLYRAFQAQCDEVDRHKWIESEKVGHDVGWEFALVDWVLKHRAGWRARQSKGVRELDTAV